MSDAIPSAAIEAVMEPAIYDMRLVMRDRARTSYEGIRQNVIGQDDAVYTVSEALIRSAFGLADPNQPRLCPILVGPTGVGKTELAESVCRHMYGELREVEDGGNFARFDMAEYQQEKDIDRLIGGNLNEQGLLGDAIDTLNANGGGIILFDEVEKAHKNICKLFLGAMDAARITMANGKKKNLSNCMLFFTSNLGAANASGMKKSTPAAIKKVVMENIIKHMSPELLNRFSAICVFRPLVGEDQDRICRLHLGKYCRHYQRVTGVGEIRLDKKAYENVQAEGYDKRFGARPLKRTIQHYVGNAIAEWLMRVEHDSTPPARLSLFVVHDSKTGGEKFRAYTDEEAAAEHLLFTPLDELPPRL